MSSSAHDPITIKVKQFSITSGRLLTLCRDRKFSTETEPNSFFEELSITCERGIKALVSLGINVLHVSGIDPSQDHKKCMDKFMEKGIYLLIDITTTSTDIYSGSPTWTNEKFSAYMGMVDAFASYTNTLRFYLVDDSLSDSTTYIAPLCKAAVRNVKDYMACGNSAIDFWVLADYSWCDNSTFTSSNCSRLTESFSDYPLPIFITDYACDPAIENNSNIAGRIFDEVVTIYGPKMSDIWSGGIVYEWATFGDSDFSDYVLVNVTDDTIQLNQNHKSLSTQLAAINPFMTQMSAYTPTITTAPSCPDRNATWAASTILPQQQMT
ncbi:glycolipid anchored surface protein [Botrytis cinerea]